MFKKIKYYLFNLLYKYLVFDLQDLLAFQQLAPLSTTFLPWTESAMRPSGLVKVLNAITILRCRCIVECGGGLSTLYIARLLKQQNVGHLYSIEHDAAWAEVLQSLLKNQALEDYVTVILAPLVSCPLAMEGNIWYDTNIIEEKIADCKIDLLLVDGPPAWQEGRAYARYPAVPYFQNFFAEDHTIILDDINRPGEEAVLRKWEELLNLKFERYRLDGTVAIGRTQQEFSIVYKSLVNTYSSETYV
jgi:hypothetical protein